MNARFVLAGALLIAACDAQPPAGQSYAELGREVANFAQVVPGRAIVFPADHGAHPDFRIEWWYVTANLVDEQGRDWGIQWTLFRSALQPDSTEEGWANQNIWMAHAAVTSPHGHRHAEDFARGGIGQAGVKGAPLDAWIDDWRLSSRSPENGGLALLDLRADGPGFAYDLQLSSSRPPVLHGDAGYSRKSLQGQASWYYSQPFFQVQGRVRWDGQEHAVRGRAWLDREWSSQPMAPNQQGWDWLALHLDSGGKLMLYQFRHKDRPSYYAGSWISADGRSRALRPDEIAMAPVGYTEIAGRRLPTSWSVRIPSVGLDISTTPVRADAWMGTRFPYWEGPVRFGGSHAGVGYLELTGY
ncbi:hypothetical protein D9M69_325910 [compost metagenome]